ENELGKSLLRPASGGGIDFIRKCADRDRNRNALRSEERELALPEETPRRGSCVGQPIERDVIDDIIARETLCLSVEYAADERLARRIVIEHPGSESDWRIVQPVKRLRTVPHFECVTDAVLVEEVELFPSIFLVTGQTGWRRPTGERR